MSVERNIREYLEDKGITQVSVSRKTGISKSQLSMSLNEKRKLTLNDLIAICGALEKTPNDFLLGVGREQGTA